MKKSTFLIVGGIIATGVVMYEVYKHFYKPSSEKCKKESVTKDNLYTAHDAYESVSAEINSSSDNDVYKTRENVVRSVRERHSEAAKAMEESLNTIFRDSENDEIETENNEILEKTGNDLSDLLK